MDLCNPQDAEFRYEKLVDDFRRVMMENTDEEESADYWGFAVHAACTVMLNAAGLRASVKGKDAAAESIHEVKERLDEFLVSLSGDSNND